MAQTVSGTLTGMRGDNSLFQKPHQTPISPCSALGKALRFAGKVYF